MSWWWRSLFAPGFVSGLKKTPKNRIGISYGGGPFESAHFQRIVQPGSSLFFNGFFDPLYLYPSDQQNYIISLTRGVGATQSPDSIVAPTADKVAVTYQVAVYFTLNTKLLRQFHEQLGLKYRAYTSKGWYNLMRDTFRQQIENALQEETRQISVADIYGSADKLVGLQTRVQQKISQRLQSALGRALLLLTRVRAHRGLRRSHLHHQGRVHPEVGCVGVPAAADVRDPRRGQAERDPAVRGRGAVGA